MGVYVFSPAFLVDALAEDALDDQSSHDFGRDILPRAAREGRVAAHLFRDHRTQRPGYWRDVGTIDSYWLAHMELVSGNSQLDFNDPSWPIWTRPLHLPPA